MRVPKQVVDDLKQLKGLGLVDDMNDYDWVYCTAHECCMDELVDWLDEHSKAEYLKVIWERLGRVKGPYDKEGSWRRPHIY